MKTLNGLVFFAAVLCCALASGASPDTTSPVELQPGTYPLVDRHLIAEMRNLTHVLHPPVRREVVLTMDRPWEGRLSGYGTVLRDPEGRIRLYYRGGGDVDPPEVTCVAWSRDGVSFERPTLGLYEIRGTRDNNVVFTAPDRSSYGESHNFAPFYDTNPAARPEEQWKAVALRIAPDASGDERRMLTVLASPDGLKWRHLAPQPVIREGAFDSLNVAFFDPHIRRYACHFRIGVRGLRSIARTESEDFLSWTTPTACEFRPPQVEHYYTNATVALPRAPGMYLAFPMRFVPERTSAGNPPRPVDGLCDAILLSSHGGRVWDRTFREAFIRPGPDPDNWGDAHCNQTPLTGLIETAPGETSIYWFEGCLSGTPRIRRGTFRTDGLASIRAGADPGELLTPPLTIPAQGERRLSLNMATSAVGSVRVEVLDPYGLPVEGWAASDCKEIVGDGHQWPVRWGDKDTLPRETPIRLRFLLKDADLYAVTIN
ncbi:MAG: hypothetical protein N2111_09935 [Candidatus Sumerlaeaceae bacterium]|nr:hypothetical protein [Candidatus Sumerlaeaceae bacterium]